MNIYVGNLPLDTTEEELLREFSAYGEVISVIIMNDKYIGSGQPRGYGYVEMTLKAEGTAAINNLSGKKMKDRVINVVEALPLSNKRETKSPNVSSNNRSNRKGRRRYQTS